MSAAVTAPAEKPIVALFEGGLKNGKKKNVKLTRKVRRAIKRGEEVSIYTVNGDENEVKIKAFSARNFGIELPIVSGVLSSLAVRFWAK